MTQWKTHDIELEIENNKNAARHTLVLVVTQKNVIHGKAREFFSPPHIELVGYSSFILVFFHFG